jgi:peptide deformylase
VEITKIPEKILSQEVNLADQEDIKSGKYTSLISDMKKAMQEHEGVGIAANQIGKNISAFVIDSKLAQEHKIQDAYFNPEITEYSKDMDVYEEGCLSIPGYYTQVKRSKKIKFKALDEKGNKARVLQHETDHLQGVLIKDRASL